MAKIIEENVVIKLSQIVKDGAPDQTTIINDELLQTLESVAQELLGNSWVVEAVTA